jgi:predicted flap endonuclease-1-like 5' DNA nuclease
MQISAYTSSLLLPAGGLAAGFLVSWVRFRLRTGREFVPLTTHREQLLTMRRRYRRRLRVVRDLVSRHKISEEQLRSEARAAATHQATQARLLTGAEAEIAALRERIAGMDVELRDREKRLSELRGEAQAVLGQLHAAREKITGFERDHGLLRIERDELVARTQRLRALPAPTPENGAASVRSEPQTPAPGPRAELAERNARIHELECQLRESRNRVSELESSLSTWKFRIAPLALHMKMQRDHAQAADDSDAGPAEPPARSADDLTRIRGIRRGLARKLRAEGVTQLEQLADMSPAELANLAVKVGIAASRPQQDRWAEQARELRPNPDAPPAGG